MAFVGKNTVRSKIVTNDRILEQVTHFNHFGCNINYKCDDIKEKLQAFQATCGTIIRTFQNRTQTYMKLNSYKVTATPALLYGSET
jgi:hypothetical protein